MKRLIQATLLALLFCATGCASYEHRLVQPKELAGHIGAKQDYIVNIGPVEYRLRTVESRLVMRIYNRTETAIQLLGDQSAAVDPDGQSHPLRSQTIAPGSFIKLLLPPNRPQIRRTGPSIGIGLGGS